MNAQSVSRRQLLQLLGAGTLSLVAAACRQLVAGPAAATAIPATPPATTPPATTPPATTPPGTATLLPATEPPATATLPAPTGTPAAWRPPQETRLTSNEEFYAVKFNPSPPPEVDPAAYHLEIGGLVDNPLSLSLADLQRFEAVTQMRTLECISNPVGGKLIGNALWKGVRLRELLQEAGVQSESFHLRLESLDGYHTGIPVSLGLDENSLLVYEMNGEPLPAEHGFPLRALWPGRYGQKQPKWLNRITVERTPHIGHWEGQGWSNEARIQPIALIEQPPARTPQPPDYFVAGTAYTSDVGLQKVEVSLDEGNSWAEATLLPGPSPLVWTHWWLRVEGADAGTYRVEARTTDNAGRSQSRPRRGQRLLGSTYPNGTDEIQQVVVQVVG